MTVDRDPREGDEFQWSEDDIKWVVDGVTRRGAVVYYDMHGNGPYVGTVADWREEAILVAPRPKVADCWGYLWRGRFLASSDEQMARESVATYPDLHTLARIIKGRVCDEHKVPLDPEAAT